MRAERPEAGEAEETAAVGGVSGGGEAGGAEGTGGTAETAGTDKDAAARSEGGREAAGATAHGGAAGAGVDADDHGEGAIEGEILEGADEAESLRQEADQARDQYLRLTADFDNFRKRTQREKQDWSRYASQSMMEKLLPVIDNLDAASAAVAGAGQEMTNMAEGFRLIQKQLTDILSQEGLAEIPALGEMFDPNVHEAVMTVSCGDGQEDNQIVMVMRKGYMFKDKVLRPAMVQVAKN
jgi:molecular chaperone GrpE